MHHVKCLAEAASLLILGISIEKSPGSPDLMKDFLILGIFCISLIICYDYQFEAHFHKNAANRMF